MHDFNRAYQNRKTDAGHANGSFFREAFFKCKPRRGAI